MKHIPSLNGLRAISIIIVIISHLVENGKMEALPTCLKLFQNGQFGVNIFFILSGFLITKILILEYELTGKISLKNFYARRTIRIFPAYYFLLACYFMLQLAGSIHLNKIEWFSALTYTRQFFTVSWSCWHFWSLSVEEFFYLLFPFTFILFYKYEKKYVYFLISLILFLFPILRITGLYLMPNTSGFNIFYRGDALLMGCILALIYDFVKSKISSNYLVPIFCLIFLLSIQFSTLYIQNPFFYAVLGKPGISLIDNILIIILIVYAIENKHTILYTFLNNKILNFIGIISYSLYLWQQLFTSKEFYFEYLSLPISVLLLLIIAISSYYVIEKPFFKFKSYFK